MCSVKRVLIKSFSMNSIDFIKKLTLKIEDILKVDVKYIGDFPISYTLYDPIRKQFLAEKFLEILVLEKDSEDEAVLGICDVDLYEPGLNFVFGMASSFYRVAIVSTTRLKNSFYNLPENFELFFERSLKESIHEIGHTLGLEHCDNIRCVMHFSNSIEDTDIKSYYFCSDCWQKAKKVLCIKE